MPPLPPTFEAALRDVKGVKPESRVAAAQRLGQVQEHELAQAVEGLCALCEDEHPAVRAAALNALSPLGHPEALEAILDRFDDPAGDVRELAVLAAAEIDAPRARQAVRSALQDERPELRFQAVAAVAETEPNAGDLLLPLLEDEDEKVRAQAAEAISSAAEPRFAKALSALLQDPAEPVRTQAALGLAALGDGAGEPCLRQALQARQRPLEVMQALGDVGGDQAREDLAKIAGAFLQPPIVRAAASAALLKLGDPRGEDGLRRVLRGLRREGRDFAVQLVGDIRATSLRPELQRLQRRGGADPATLAEALTALDAPNH